jgi:hypothetical protein
MKTKNVEEICIFSCFVLLTIGTMIAYRKYWLMNNHFENDE